MQTGVGEQEVTDASRDSLSLNLNLQTNLEHGNIHTLELIQTVNIKTFMYKIKVKLDTPGSSIAFPRFS